MKPRPQLEQCSRCGRPFPAPQLIRFRTGLLYCPECSVAIILDDSANPDRQRQITSTH